MACRQWATPDDPLLTSRTDGVEFGGEVEVFVADAPGVVGAEGEGDFVVADEDVGVVLVGLGQVSRGTDEGHRLHEVGKGPSAADGISDACPLWPGDEGGVDLRVCELRDGEDLGRCG